MEPARAATANDVPRIVELALELRAELRPLRGGALWETRESRVEPVTAAIDALMARADACVAVGTIDGVVVAYGTAEIEPLRDGTMLGVIGDIYVEPGARQVGVGEEVALLLVDFCARAGCMGVDAFALPGSREAKNFFERSGFTARALVMHKKL